ncbi:response regulator transcription factor [Marinobacteraceae bacterium S3BR75-40.1]
MTVKKVILIDDHSLVRAGLKAVIENLDGYRVVAEGDDGDQVLDLVLEHQPDVLILDLEMRKVSGLDALLQLQQHDPKLPVIILSMHDNADFVVEALERGASGYLLKNAAQVELELALQVVLEGQLYLSPRISRDVIGQLFAASRTVPNQKEKDPLTPRQREILRLLAEGRSTKEIAYHLDLSVKTVESHRSQIMDRLGIRDIAGLIHYALKTGMIELDGSKS